jgi:integrase
LFEELYFSSFRNRRSSGNIMAPTHSSNCVSSVAHSSFLVQTAPNKEGNSQSKIKKLHNIIEKLHNIDELTEAEKRLLFSTSLQDYAYLLDQAEYEWKAEQHELDKRKVEALEQWLQLQKLQEPKKPDPDNILAFSKDELDNYVAHRKEGLAVKSHDWINRASCALWDCTTGEISQTSMTALRTFVLGKYPSVGAEKIALGFAIAFLKYLSKIRFDARYLTYSTFLELPKTVRVRKAITERIVTKADISVAFKRIEACVERGEISAPKARNYRAFVRMASYTGLRPSTLQRLTVGQFRAAVNEEKPVAHVLAQQEKSRVEHYVPLHPSVVNAVDEVLTHDFSEKDDAKPFFMWHSFGKWLFRQKIPLPRVKDAKKAHLWLSDFRKFAEQFGDIIGWDATNRQYVLAHDMTGVAWGHYKHPLPENVFDVYMQSWGGVELES